MITVLQDQQVKLEHRSLVLLDLRVRRDRQDLLEFRARQDLLALQVQQEVKEQENSITKLRTLFLILE